MSDVISTTDATLTLKDGVATLTLNRDGLRNALTGTTLVDDIVNTITWANRCTDVRVIVLTGAGSAFSAGGNIKEMRDRTGAFAGNVAEVEAIYRAGIQRMPLAVHGAEVPIIAAVNGAAIGAGCDLACMCDIRIGSTAAAFGETFANLGIIPGDGGAWFLQRLVGYQRAAEMTITGRIVKADEAKDLGLLLEITEPENLLDRAQEIATQIAAKPPQALRYTKRLLKLAQRMELPEFLDMCATFQGICHNTEDHSEAVAAFLEKRPAKFTGR